jgi:methanol:N,N-dimethyl-4-nitrosoaniline oxidoreductase
MAGVECNTNNIKPALLITTGLNGTGIVEEIEGILKYTKVSVTRFSGVTSNLKDYEGVKAYRDAKCGGWDRVKEIGTRGNNVPKS